MSQPAAHEGVHTCVGRSQPEKCEPPQERLEHQHRGDDERDSHRARHHHEPVPENSVRDAPGLVQHVVGQQGRRSAGVEAVVAVQVLGEQADVQGISDRVGEAVDRQGSEQVQRVREHDSGGEGDSKSYDEGARVGKAQAGIQAVQSGMMLEGLRVGEGGQEGQHRSDSGGGRHCHDNG